MEPGVFGLINDTHPAFADLLDDPVVGNGLSNQRRTPKYAHWSRDMPGAAGIIARAARTPRPQWIPFMAGEIGFDKAYEAATIEMMKEE